MFYFLASYFYLEFVGRKLQFSIVEDQIKLFPNDEGKFTIKIEQQSWLPIFFGSVLLAVDKNISFHIGEERKQLNLIKIPFTIFGKRELQIEVPFIAKKRGVAKIHRVDIEIGHFIDYGKVYLQKVDLTKLEVVVYSDQRKVSGLKRIIPKNQGNYPSKSAIIEDLTTIVGTRDYQNGDPFNKIHWKASARMAGLQTKMFERSSQFSWLIVLDIRASYLEERIKVVTFLLHHAASNHIPFSLIVNSKKVGKPSYFELPNGEGKRHLQLALTFLARLQVNSVAIGMHSFEKITYQHALSSPYVIVCADQESVAGWHMPTTSHVYGLAVSDQTYSLHQWRSFVSQEVQHG